MAKTSAHKEELIGLVREKLEMVFAETNMVEKITVWQETREAEGADFVMELFVGGSPRVLLVEVRTSGEPRLAREAVNHLLVVQHSWSHAFLVFAAPYISEQAAQICEKHQVGYMDLAGNCRIAIDGLYLHTRGRPNVYTNKRRLKSLSRPKAARILRVLLNHPRRHWKTRDLAAEAGVSPGLVSNVKQILKDREWIDNRRQRIILARPRELLDHWAASGGPDETVSFFYTPMDFIQAENALTAYCREKKRRCAFTGLSAAVHLASGIDYYRQVQARVQGGADLLANEPGFEKTGSKRANMAIVHSPDAGSFYGMRPVPAASRLQYCRPSEKTVADIEKDIHVPMVIVSPVQVYMDLVSVFGGGQKEAGKILQQVLDPSW